MPLISTHALREEGDRTSAGRCSGHRGFLPTPSARRATVGVFDRLMELRISTHALREEGDYRHKITSKWYAISTHALREEGDGFPSRWPLPP